MFEEQRGANLSNNEAADLDTDVGGRRIDQRRAELEHGVEIGIVGQIRRLRHAAT